MLKVQKNPHINFLESHEKQAKRYKRHVKQIFVFRLVQDMEKWFERLHATQLLHDATLDSSMNDGFLQCKCINMTWGKRGGSLFTRYSTYVLPNDISIFFVEGRKPHMSIMLKPICLSTKMILKSIYL